MTYEIQASIKAGNNFQLCQDDGQIIDGLHLIYSISDEHFKYLIKKNLRLPEDTVIEIENISKVENTD